MSDPIDNATVYVAIITAGASVAGVIVTLLWNSRAARNERQRDQFSTALSTVLEYWEFAYIVQRREPGDSGSNRARISTDLNRVQRELAHHTAWMSTGPGRIRKAYERLVLEARNVAGSSMHDAWNADPSADDSSMNVEKLNDTSLRQFEAAYVTDVKDHIAITPAIIRRLARLIWARATFR